MTEQFSIPTTDNPTMFNKDMAIGALAGRLIGGFIGAFAGPVGSSIGALAGAAIGGAWRGVARKAEMEAELALGKPAKAPSHLNKDTLLGGLLGLSAGGIIARLLLNASLGGVVLTGSALTTAAPVIAVTAIAALAVGTVAGAIIGGRHGHERMANEYKQAIESQVHSQGYSRGKSQEMVYDNNVTRNHGADISEQRARASEIAR